MSEPYVPSWLRKPSLVEVSQARRDCSKPLTTIKAVKQAAGRAVGKVRDLLRALVFQKDKGRCRKCDRKVFLNASEAPHELAIAHVHEWIPRSLGGDPLEPTNCILLCSTCHPLVTEHKLDIVALDPVRLMRGPVEFIKGAAA